MDKGAGLEGEVSQNESWIDILLFQNRGDI